MNKRRFGIIGEKIVQSYLKNKEYKIIKTNYFTKRGEIDIIAIQNECLVFVEVKTRTNYKYGTPAMAVKSRKIKHMKYAAKLFILLNNFEEYEIRFDVVEVFIHDGKCKINHIEGII